MRKLFCFILLLAIHVQGFAIGRDTLYHKAYQEICAMLDGQAPLSIKRAVYLAEWAYLDGDLDYERDFCQEIRRIADYVNRVIAANHWEHYKTAKEFTLCDYFFRPCRGNGQRDYTYEYDGRYPTGDWHYQLISRTLKTHQGQCHSLPWAFRLIAEELGAKAYIAHAPRHCFIMYEDLDDHYPEDWVNVELTSHQYVPTFWMKDFFCVSDSALAAGTYLTPLSDQETVACQLADLALGYYTKYQLYDDFILQCASKSVEYYAANPTAIILMGNSLDDMLHAHLQQNGGYKDSMTDYYDFQLQQCRMMLDATHWTQETPELRKKWNENNLQPKDVQILTKEQYEEILKKK